MEIAKPRRITRTGTLRIRASADDVFPLMCPVREKDWLEDWTPLSVYSESGVVEPGCAFTSKDDNGESTWLVVQHDPDARELAMVKITPGFTACHMAISVSSVKPGLSEVTVSYTHTALGPRGEQYVKNLTAPAFEKTMAFWQTAIEHYLSTGERLKRDSVATRGDGADASEIG